MKEKKPIWRFSTLVIVLWISVILSSIAVRLLLPNSIQKWVYWAAGILVVVLGIADVLSSQLKSRVHSENHTGELPGVSALRDVGHDLFLIGGDQVYGDKVAGDKYATYLVPSEYEPPSAVPPPATGDEYIERELTSTIRAALERHHRTGITGRAGIAGMGGIGKSEIAKRLAQELAPVFPGGVYWLQFGFRGDSPRPIEDVVWDLLFQLNVQPDPQGDIERWLGQVQQALCKGDAPRLLIYDDVRETHARFLKDDLLLPPTNCALLITTRLQALAALPAGALHPLDVFDPDEAKQLVRTVLGDETCDAEPTSRLDEILELCGHLPLAVNVAARRIDYEKRIRGSDQPILSYLTELRDTVRRLDALDLKLIDAELSVRAVLQTSYDSLDPATQKRFDQLGVFSGDAFPALQLVFIWWPNDFWGLTPKEVERRKAEIQERLDMLVERSMLQPAGENRFTTSTLKGRYKLHSLWRDFARERLHAKTDLMGATLDAHAETYAAFAGQYSEPRYAHLLLAEFDEIEAAIQWTLSTRNYRLLWQLVFYTQQMMQVSGRWTKAKAWAEDVLRTLKGNQDREHRNVRAAAQFALAVLETRLGNYTRAENLLREAIQTVRDVGDMQAAAQMLVGLVDLEARRGDREKVEELLDDLREELEGFEDTGQSLVLQGIAAESLLERGYYELAERMHQEGLKAYREQGDRFGFTVRLGKLANVEWMRRNRPKAEALAREYLTRAEEIRAEGEVAIAQSLLADIEAYKGNFEEAEQLLHKAMEASSKLGDKPGEAVKRAKLGRVLIATDRQAEGCALLEEALDTLRNLGDRQATEVEHILRRECGNPEQQEAARIEELRDFVARNTIAAMAGDLNQRHRWFGEVRHNLAEAQSNDETQLVSLLTAISHLLMGDSIEQLKPDLEGAYAECWSMIESELRDQ